MIKYVVTVSLLALMPFAQAEKKKSLHEQYVGQEYGMAGCGLGSVVFGNQKGFVQVVAATLNGTSNSQTFGITSGTSNCGESGKVARANEFIETNKLALDNDIARGSGEALVALSISMGCHNTDFSTKVRSQWVPGASNDTLAQVAAKSCQLRN